MLNTLFFAQNINSDVDFSGNGYLYNWYALIELAPSGWHVPTFADWKLLSDYLGGSAVSGGILKETGFFRWCPPNPSTNTYNFMAYGSGQRRGWYEGSPDLSGYFSGFRYISNFWMSGSFYDMDSGRTYTRYASLSCYDTILSGIDDTYTLYYQDYTHGNSVRLVKSASFNTGTVQDNDGNIYDTVKIGTQVWTAQNWKCTTNKYGAVIPTITDTTAWNTVLSPAKCLYNNNEIYL